MKVSGIFFAVTMLATSAVAFAGCFGEGYNNRLNESRNLGDSSGQWVYLNSPSEYQGPGRLTGCQKVSTYQGGPKGSWRTYYVCRVSN